MCQEKMADDVDMLDVESTAIFSKGKGKAKDAPKDMIEAEESLPW